MRRRLTRSIVLVAAAAVVLFALPLAFVAQRSYRAEELLRLQQSTVAATRAVDISGGSADRPELPPSSDRLAVYDTAGRRISGNGPARADAVVAAALRRAKPADQARGNSLIAAVPLVVNERVEGALRAERPDAAAERATRRVWAGIGATGVIVIALAAAAAAWLGRMLAAPLEQLAVSARRLGAGDFGARVDATGVEEADEVAAALNSTAERLDDLVTRERAFSADASHQLRTPLAALRIEIESLQLEGVDAPQLERAAEQLDRVEATVETLLAVARDIPRRSARFELVPVLDQAADRWRGRFAAAGRPLRLSVTGVSGAVAASPQVVNEILDVLLDNAFAHGDGEVEMRARERDGWVVIEVQDHGRGFAGDPEDAFARRGSGARGHGIGLALARSLAHAEGGSLAVVVAQPEPVISLVLPRAQIQLIEGSSVAT